MKLLILQPNRTLFNGDVEYVTLPGKKGLFSLLPGHAPLISTLNKGELRYLKLNKETPESLSINGGVIKIKKDLITVCLD